MEKQFFKNSGRIISISQQNSVVSGYNRLMAGGVSEGTNLEFNYLR